MPGVDTFPRPCPNCVELEGWVVADTEPSEALRPVGGASRRFGCEGSDGTQPIEGENEMHSSRQSRVVPLGEQRIERDDHYPGVGFVEPLPDSRLPAVNEPRCALWDPASGQFDVSRLRAAIVGRGWTVPEFAATAGASRGTVYRALGGIAVSDRTGVRGISALESRARSGLIDG